MTTIKYLEALSETLGSFDPEDDLRLKIISATAQHVSTAAKGYVELIRIGLSPAARLLIRPALEGLFIVQALVRNPEILFRVGYTQYLNDLAYLNTNKSLDAHKIKEFKTGALESLKTSFEEACPSFPKIENKILIEEIAKKAEIPEFYNTYYRYLSQFVHGSFRATSGSLGDHSKTDQRIMDFSCLQTVVNLIQVGFVCRQITELQDEFCSESND
jgi:Family of unknown function (DUF5677)